MKSFERNVGALPLAQIIWAGTCLIRYIGSGALQLEEIQPLPLHG